MEGQRRSDMNRLLAAAFIATLLGGCAYDGDRDDVVVGVNAGYGGNVGYYDGYYDGYYGPFYDGYWGTDGFFYFADVDGRRWNRDTDGHFRHQPQSGFRAVHGHGASDADMPNHP
jgi:hypothetical protein